MTCVAASADAAVPADTPTAPADTVGRTFGEVTVTAQRLPVEGRAMLPAQSIGAGRIASLGIRNMADAVRRFAGANVRDYGGIGGLKTVSVRNMGASHTAVSYDGVAVSNCQGGQIDIGRFTLDNVASVSLYTGHADDPDLLLPARLYGSAAVLAINSATPEFAEGRNSRFDIGVKGGSFGYASPMARWWQRWGASGLTTAVFTDYTHADGNYPFTLVNGKYVTRERRNNSEINSWHAEVDAGYNISRYGGRLSAKGYYFYSRRGLPGPVMLYNPVSTETLYDKDAFAQMTYERRFSHRVAIKATGKFTYGWNRDRRPGKEFAGGVLQDFHTQREYYATVAASYMPHHTLRIALAQDGAVNTLRNTIADCPLPRRYTSLTALNVGWRPSGHLSLAATAVATLVAEHVERGDAPPTRRNFAPTLALRYCPLTAHALYLRAMMKSTYRVPAFNDLYYERMGNRSLRPERATQWNIGASWTSGRMGVADYVAITADAYYNRVTDKIVAFPTTFAWHMVNYGRVEVRGVDVTLATCVTPTNGFAVDLTAAGTLQRAIDVTDRSAKNYRHQLPYTPELSGNAGVTLRTPWVTAGYSVVAVGKRYFLSQNVRENEIAGYAEQTVTLGREFRLPRGIALSARLELINFTDRQYDIIKYYPMPGRSLRVAANVKF